MFNNGHFIQISIELMRQKLAATITTCRCQRAKCENNATINVKKENIFIACRWLSVK